MTFAAMPALFDLRSISTGSLCELGGFTPDQIMELAYLQFTVVKVGAQAGSERIRVAIYPTAALDTAAIVTSSWVNIADLNNISSSSWMGWVRFDFTRTWIDPDTTYYLAAEAGNYTDNGDTFYIGFKDNYPDTVYSGGVRAAQMRLFGYV